MLAYSPLSASSAWQCDISSCTRRSTVATPLRNRRRRKLPVLIARSGGRRGGLRLAHQALGLIAGDPVEVVAVLEQHDEGVVDRLRVERHAVERSQAVGTVDGLGDPGQLEQLGLAQPLHEGHHFLGERGACFGRLAMQDLELAARVGVVDPVVEAAPLHRVVDLARAVGGDDHDRRLGGAQGADLGDGDLPVGQHLQQVGLERLVGAVELVDEQHRRGAGLALERARERPPHEEALRVDVRGELLLRFFARRLREADLHHLPRVVPLVGGLRDVQPFVALQAQQLAVQSVRDDLGDLGLADAGLAFQEERPLHGEREEKRSREAAIGDIVAGAQELLRLIDGSWSGAGHERRNLTCIYRNLSIRYHPGTTFAAAPSSPGIPYTSQEASMEQKQLKELLLQSLEHERGGVKVYQTAIKCAVNEDLKEEWEKYLEQTEHHVEVLQDVFSQMQLDAEEQTPGRKIVHDLGLALVSAMEAALGAGNPEAAQIVACECVTLAETKDHMDWELIG